MRLVDLEPVFLTSHGPPPHPGAGVQFDCPCGSGERRYVPFAVGLDGHGYDSERGWARSGVTFNTLTLTPSIEFKSGCCRWHGHVTAGEMVTV